MFLGNPISLRSRAAHPSETPAGRQMRSTERPMRTCASSSQMPAASQQRQPLGGGDSGGGIGDDTPSPGSKAPSADLPETTKVAQGTVLGKASCALWQVASR